MPSSSSDRRERGRERVAVAGVLQTTLRWGAPALLIGLLSWPMLLTSDPLGGDWIRNLSLVWSQSQELRLDLHPSFFLNSTHSVLYPIYAFYGGTIYTLTGALSLLLGGAPIDAYVATYLMGFAAAYGGWYWIGRMAGLGRWLAQAPGLVFITSGYYLTLIYTRGDWPEFLAVSTIPLLVASSVSVLRAEQLRPWPALALVGSVVVFFGSHVLTVIWGSTVLALSAALSIVFVPAVRPWLAPRRVARVVGLGLVALLVDAWFLLPMIAYESHTLIASNYHADARGTLESFMPVVAAAHLFSVDRVPATPGTLEFIVTLPTLVIAWILIVMLFLLRRGVRGAPWSRMLLLSVAVTCLIVLVMTHAGILLALPWPYPTLEFSYRLVSFVLLGVSAAVLAVLAIAQREAPGARRVLIGALLPALVVAVVGAADQIAARPEGGGSRQAAVTVSEGVARLAGSADYAQANLPFLAHPKGAPELGFSPSSLHDDSASYTVPLGPGQVLYTNIGGGPDLVHVTGAKIIGTTLAGGDVLEVGASGSGRARKVAGPRDAARPAQVISIAPASGLPVVLGRLLTLGAMSFLVGGLLLLLLRRSRRSAD